MYLVLLYVDPGSGSYLVQMIIAGIVGALFYFKNIWYRLKSFFAGKKENKSASPNEGNE
jgi:hypothetical protein